MMDISRKKENIVNHMQTYGSRIPWEGVSDKLWLMCKSHQQCTSTRGQETENKKASLLSGLSVYTTNPVPGYQDPCTWDSLYRGTLQCHGSTSLLISHPELEGLSKAEIGEWLKSEFRIQRWGEMLYGDADLSRGDYGHGQGSEGKGAKMHLFSSLSVTFFLYRMQILQ